MSQETLTTFILFNELPKEIRLMIWEHALPDPRIVELQQAPLVMNLGEWEASTGTTHTDDDLKGMIFSGPDISMVGSLRTPGPDTLLVTIQSNCPPPDLFFASKESRAVVTKHYPMAFSTFGSVAKTPFDFERDTLYLPEENFSYNAVRHLGPHERKQIWGLQTADELKKVQHLAIGFAEYDEDYADEFQQEWGRPYLEGWLAYLLSHFRGVKTLTLVIEHYDAIGPDAPAEASSTLYFEDPIDLVGIVDQYALYDMLPRDETFPDEEDFDRMLMPEVYEEAILAVSNKPGYVPLLLEDLPVIEWKICLTESRMQELTSARVNHQEKYAGITSNATLLQTPTFLANNLHLVG